MAELYDVAVVPGVVQPIALGFASNEILGLITHDPVEKTGPSEGGCFPDKCGNRSLP